VSENTPTIQNLDSAKLGSRRPFGEDYRVGTLLASRSGFVFQRAVQPSFSTLVRKMTVLSRAMSSDQMNLVPSKSLSK
jgi:hypothetical protein